MSARRATRSDVADRAGVSTAVVSYVVNNGPRPVSESTRARVQDAIDELGYRPNSSARALKLSRTDVVGVMVDDLVNPFFSEFATFLQRDLNRAGASMLLGTTHLDRSVETSQVSALLDHEVDGVIVFSVGSDATLRRLQSSGIPVISLDWGIDEGILPTIQIDAYAAATGAISHLSDDHGYDEVAFVGGPNEWGITTSRYNAWRDAMLERLGAERCAQIEFFGEFTNDGGYRAGKELVARQRRPRSVFVSTDVQAVGVLRACHEAGVRVPEDLAVMSFDGTRVSEFTTPALSAVHVPVEDMSLEATAWVLGGHKTADSRIVIPTRLVLRESCGCPRPS